MAKTANRVEKMGPGNRGGANSGFLHKPCFRKNRVFEPFEIRVFE